MKKIAIIGGGGHAKVVASIILKLNEYEIIGYIDLKESEGFLDLPYLGNDEEFILKYSGAVSCVALGIGQIEISKFRKTIVSRYKKANFNFPTIISPNAVINKNVQVGSGTVVMDGVVVNVDTQIGKYSIINTNSTVEHDCKISNFVHITPGVTLSGNASVGNNSMIGVGTTIIQSIEIAEDVFIGAGSVVTKSIDSAGKYFGSPLRKIKS